MPTADSLLQQAWQIHQQGQVQRRKRSIGMSQATATVGQCLVLPRYRPSRSTPLFPSDRSLQRALAIQPEFPIALNNMGNSLRYVFRAEEADASFQKAIDLKPDYVNAHKIAVRFTSGMAITNLL